MRLLRLSLITLATLSFAGRSTAQTIVPIDDNGRRIYVNQEDAPSVPKLKTPVPEASLLEDPAPQAAWVYWSTREHRFKPVPRISSAAMRNARSAVNEVRRYLAASQGSSFNLVRVSKRATLDMATLPREVDAAIEQAAARHQVDPNLVRAIVKVESDFNPHAVSRKGALGLMQLMPSTAKSLKVSDPFDPQQNVDAGVRHLKALLENFSGDLPRTLAAYNAGERAVERSRGVPPYAETRKYVSRITELYGSGSPFARFGAPMKVSRSSEGVLTVTNTE